MEVTFCLYMNQTCHIPSSVSFSSPKFHTSDLTAILYMFMTQTHQPINEFVIVTALSWQLLSQTRRKASPLKMGAVQGERTVFSTSSCIGGQQWLTLSQPRHF